MNLIESGHVSPQDTSLPSNTWVEVLYIVATGGSGYSRMELGAIVYWLQDHPGYLIHCIRVV